MRICIVVFAGILLCAVPAFAQNDAELDAQLNLLMSWWQGDYDNNEQIVRQSGGGLAEPVYEPIFRLHSRIERVDIPALGENVLFIEEYKNNDPDELYRVRLISIEKDLESHALRGKLYAISDEEQQNEIRADLSKLASVDPDDLFGFRDQCDVIINFEGGQFRGAMARESCDLEESWFEYQLVIGSNHYWFRDQRRSLADGSVVWELAPGSDYAFFELTKARWFSCVVNYNLDGDMTKTEFLTNVKLHDQGGEAAIDYPDGRELSLVIHSRAFTSPPDRTYPIFRVHERGEHVPIAYGYAVDEAERFGLNLGWFYTLCRIETDEDLVTDAAAED